MSRRLETGPRVILLCGVIFLGVGILFLVLTGWMVTHPQDLEANGRGAVWMLPLIFGGLGAVCTVVGALVLRWQRRSQQKTRRLLERGDYVLADITSFPIDPRMTVNGLPTFRVECSYRDPMTNTMYVFQSRNVFPDPSRSVTAKTVRVYVDRSSGYRDYYVDVDSILPRVKRM